MARFTNRHSLTLAVVGALFAAAPAEAAETATFQVSANVTRNCTIAATAIDFGAYDPIAANDSAAVNRTGTIAVKCTKGTSYSVKLDLGDNATAGNVRQMASGGAMLAYALYSDAPRTIAWNETTFVSGVAAGRSGDPLTVYAALPGGQDVPEGSYVDVVTATVEF
jgi:spore coat protein U-like protein